VHLQANIAFRFGTPEQTVKAVNFYICKKSQKLIGYHNNVHWATANHTQAIAIHFGTPLCQINPSTQILP